MPSWYTSCARLIFPTQHSNPFLVLQYEDHPKEEGARSFIVR